MKQLLEFINSKHVLVVDNELPEDLMIKLRVEVNKRSDWIILYSNEDIGGKFRELYTTYEFADNVVFLSKVFEYPSLLNLLEQGILTVEELVEGILFK